MEAPRDVPTLDIICKIRNLPLISSTVDHVSNSYSYVKSYNRLFKLTLDTTERTFLMVYVPFFQHFNKPITIIDGVACQVFDFLECKIPALSAEVTKHGTEIATASHAIITQKVHSIHDYGTKKVAPVLHSQLVQKFHLSLESSLLLSHAILDYYLPPDLAGTEERRPSHFLLPNRNRNLFHQTKHFTNTLRARVHLHFRQLVIDFSTYCDEKSDLVIKRMEQALERLQHQVLSLIRTCHSMLVYFYDGIRDNSDRIPPQWYLNRGSFLLGLGIHRATRKAIQLNLMVLDYILSPVNREKIRAAFLYSLSLYTRILMVRSRDQVMDILHNHSQHKITVLEMRLVGCLQAIAHAPLLRSIVPSMLLSEENEDDYTVGRELIPERILIPDPHLD